VEQEKPLKNSMKMTMPTKERKMSNYEKKMMKEKYYESTESRTWLAPKLQGVSNPRSLATFQIDVYAEGLVFGSILWMEFIVLGINTRK
jgi:hypothetical protein